MTLPTSLELRKRIKRILRTHNKKNFKIIKVNIQKNSINGIVFINNKKFFYKFVDEKSGEREIKGYLTLLEKYPVPGLDSVIRDYDDILILYNFEKSIAKNKGLLSDEINRLLPKNKKINLDDIFTIWKENFSDSVRWGFKLPGNSSFFKERIKTGGRYDQWYSQKKIKINGDKISFQNLLKKEFIVNGKNMKRNPSQIHTLTKKIFTKRRKIIELISQGDPIEMNIGVKPIFFDFENAGLDDFLGENAIFIYSILIDGGYFSPKYHKNAFWMHNKLIKNIKKHSPEKMKYDLNDKEVIINYDLKIPKVRAEILQKYFKEIIKPVLKKTKLSMEKYLEQISLYLFLRFICVHNIIEMSQEDMFLSLAMICEIQEFGLVKYLKKIGVKI